jgi:hypothetical protein
MSRPEGDAPFSLETDPFGRLVYAARDGTRHVGVELVRAFPLSDPEGWIIVVDADGREVAGIADPGTLPPSLREALRAAMARRELVPVLVRIRDVSAEAPPSEWDVDTDRGRTRFTLLSEDDLRRLGDDGLLIRDAQGMRYLVPALSRLDRASRRWLERHL